MIVFLQLVVNGGAVFTVNHEDSFFDLNAVDFIGKHRKRIEAKLFEVAEALGMNYSRVPVGGKLKTLSIDEQGLFDLREEHQTADRWFRGSYQQPVIAAGCGPGDRACAIAT